jgi:hypothetical protein
MNPKPLSKTKEETLRAVARGTVEAELTPRLAREILAALEYERQRAITAGHDAASAVAAMKRRAKGPWSQHFD